MAADSAEVLLIDDPERVAEVETELRSRLDGLSFVTAADTVEALELLDRRAIDCVVSNYEVPDENGVEFLQGLELLQAVRERSPDLPFILFTEIGNEEIAQKAIAAGVTEYIVRWGEEYAYDRLADRLESAIARRQAERRAAQQTRINEVIRDINQALVRASTHEEIVQSVCAQLASSDQYAAAWCGALDSSERRFEPHAWGGVDAASDGPIWVGDDTAEAIDRAIRTGDVQIVTDEAGVSWSDDRATESVTGAVIPFVFQDECYGALAVYTGRPAAFDETEHDVLSELGETIAYALDAVQARRAIEARERELQRQNEQLDEFVSIVSHDIRNPLSVGQMYLEEVKQDVDHDDLEEIEVSLNRMEQLVDDLLTLARQGRRIESPVETRLAEVVERAWENVETGEADLERQTDIGTIRADADRLVQALENLFRNSVEHGGDAPTIRVGRLADGGFYVEDDGPGIDGSDPEMILEMGYSTNETGTGFGLGIVDEIVDAHGWSLTVGESEADGATDEQKDERCESSAGARFEIRTTDQTDDQ
jgi:signal transduction histidine kinase/CheY-like chemotaxis protein